MPNRWAVASGNWSNTATWNNGGVLGLPTASDDVFANNQTITIDQNITINSLSTTVLANTASYGGRYITSGSVTIETFASGTYGGFLHTISSATSSVVLVVTGSDTVNIKAVRIASAPNSGGAPTTASINIQSNGTTNISASNSIQGITGAAISITTISGGIVNIQCPAIYGDTFGGGGATRTAIFTNVAGTIDITGSLRSGTNNFAYGFNSNATSGIVNLKIRGDIYNLTNIPTILLNNSTTTNLTITGSVYTPNISAISNAACISSTGTVTNINISGSVIGGKFAGPISVTSAGSSSIIGPIYASFNGPGVSFTAATHFLTATGPFYNVNNRNAVFAQNLQLISGSTPTWTFGTETNLEQRTLYTTNYPGNFPSTTNVRQGVIFGDMGQFTGTIAIPSASNVLQGVPVDTTTGSASFNTQNVWSLPTSSLTITRSIGARLRNASTVATDAALITSKKKL